MSRRARKAEAHVRFYRHELESAAFRSLTPDARALLIELRALFGGHDNQVFMSRGSIEQRLGVGRWRAERARDELLDRGFIRLHEKASFDRKVRHAPTYILTNEPINPNQDGAVAPKDFMRWKPAERKSTRLVTNPDAVGDQPRAPKKSTRTPLHGAGDQPREALLERGIGAGDQPTDMLPGGARFPACSELLFGALQVDAAPLQFQLCLAAAVLAHGAEAAS